MFRQFFASKKYLFWAYFGSFVVLLLCFGECFFDTLSNSIFQHASDLTQNILNPSPGVKIPERKDFLNICFGFFFIEVIGVSLVNSAREFLGQHIAWRWRTSLTEYYLNNWSKIRTIEGSAQRIQEDCQQFANSIETLLIELLYKFIKALTFYRLVVFYGKKLEFVPFFGSHSHSLFFGSLCIQLVEFIPLVVIGYKLPQIEYENQVYEAAFRKELVLSEEDHSRLDDKTNIKSMFSVLRDNSFSMYKYIIFVDAAGFIIQMFDRYMIDLLIMPSLITRKISFGDYNGALSAVLNFLWVISSIRESWTFLIEIASIKKRLRGFEAILARKNYNLIPQV